MSDSLNSVSETKVNHLTKSTMIHILSNGQYYKPAYTHYGNDVNQIVECDRCFKSKLPECFGQGLYDLCLKCKDEIQSFVDQDALKINDDYSHNYMAPMMEQAQFYTKMKQSQFNK